MDNHYRIVVGMDLDEPGDHALRAALDFARRSADADVHVVHVLAPRADNDVGAMSRALEEALAKLEGRTRAVAGQTVSHTVRLHVRYGGVVETITQVCVDYDADLVVVGTHGRRGAARLVLGSIAAALVESAPLPVIVARPKDYSGLARSPSLDPKITGADLHRSQLVSEVISVGPRVSHVSGLL
jgi:nucleotide-binding universal stress UspA family protein